MPEFILQLLETERFLSAILLLVVVGFGWFFAKYFWPWFTERVDKTIDSWLELKRTEIQVEAKRNERFSSAWRENNKQLSEMRMAVTTLVEGQKALIGTLLSFVDNREMKTELTTIFHEDGQ